MVFEEFYGTPGEFGHYNGEAESDGM